MTRLARSLLIFLATTPAVAAAQTGEEVPVTPSEPPPAPAPPAEPEPEPAPAPAPEPEKPSKPALAVSYDKGVLFHTADEAFQLRLALRNQFRFETVRETGEGADDDADDPDEWQSRFYIPRTRLQLEGHVFGRENRYKLEFAFGDRGSFAFVRDLYLDKSLGGPVWFRLGQWKRPFNRQELVSDFGSELNERAITAEFVGGGRDLGVAIHNDYEKSPDGLEWVVGVFNGFSGGGDRPRSATSVDCVDDPATPEVELACEASTTNPATAPTDFGPALVARVGWNLGGIKGYSEGDLEGGPFRLAVGASYKVDLADLEGSDAMSHGVQADALLKVRGLDVQLGVYLMKLETADAELGFLAQGGYMVVPKRAQVALRFAQVPSGGDETLHELRAGFNWFWAGHAFKWMTDGGFLHDTTEGTPSIVEVRTMMQLTF